MIWAVCVNVLNGWPYNPGYTLASLKEPGRLADALTVIVAAARKMNGSTCMATLVV